eukprot:546016_1
MQWNNQIHAMEQSLSPILSNYTNTNYTNYISINYTHWDVNVLHQTGWNFIIKTDERFAIDTIYDSTIEFTTNIYQSPNTQALIFGFTTDNKRYISTSIPMDSFGKVNKIYPLSFPSICFW